MVARVSLRSRPLVTVDARMLHSTGIGTYLRALLPRVIERLPEANFLLLGDPAAFEREGLIANERVQSRAVRAGIYAPGEQPALLAATPRETTVFWAPHVNAPLAGPGRLVVTVHDVFYANPPPGAEPRWDKALYLHLMLRGVRRRARAIICVSAFTRGELERLVGPFPGELHTVPSGIEPFWFERPEGERPHPRPYLVYVGNLKPHKNLPRTLSAFAAVAERVPHDFLLVGPGDPEPLRASLPAAVAGRVHFRGTLAGDLLKLTLAHASGLVLASLYEGFGLPPLEAMALGVPVLVSRAASLPEVCGDAALYCEPESTDDIARGLSTLLLDEAERARLILRGKSRVRAFDWNESADKTSAVIRALLVNP
jgi:glycosyltransferase involved in cell wall biosynthesis